MTEETCVLCNGKLESKEALQAHFRKHANKEIDGKGRPIAKIISVSEAKPVILQTKKSGPRSPLSLLKPSSSLDKSVSPGPKKPINCDVCELPFDSAAKAISHRWKAHPKQPSKFCCSHCGKQFPLKTILDNHVANQHTNVTPQNVVKCEDCGEEFFNQPALNYHAQITHKRIESVLRPVATPPPSKKIRLNNAGEAESVYYCHLCGSEYILKFNLRKHLEVRHADEDTSFGPQTEIIRCTICEAVFCNKKAYDVHNMYHTPDDMYVTSEEHRLKIVSRVDQDFDLRRVHLHMPKSVRGLAKHHANLVWNANRLMSDVEPKDKVEEDTLYAPKSPSKGKAKGKRTLKRKRSNSFCGLTNGTPVIKKKEFVEETTGSPKSSSKGKTSPSILKGKKTQNGNSLSSPPAVDKRNPIKSTRSKVKPDIQVCREKGAKMAQRNSSSNSNETSELETSKRVLRSRVSKNE